MSHELNIDLGQTGLTVTASVYLAGVVKASGIACAEIGVTGKYSGNFSASPNVAGVYQVAFFVGGATVSSGGGQVVWDGTVEVVQTGDSFARIGAAGAGLTALLPAGAGAIAWTYTVTNSVTSQPIADVDVWVTSDAAGENVLASGRTDQNGAVTFNLDAGTVYVWSQKSGFNFSNPDTETVA